MIAKGVRAFFILLALVPWLWWRMGAVLSSKNEAFQGASQFCALFPGKIGTLFRAAFYRLSLEQTSQRTSIAFLSSFSHAHASLGPHVSIGAQCNIGWAHIGKDCIISSQVCITSGKNQHAFDDMEKEIRLQDSIYTPVHIGDNCWIGAGAIIMADIGQGSVIAAGSVVTQPIPPFSIAAGNPAKVVRTRGEQEHIEKRIHS